jgi:EGF-like domain
VFPAGSRCASQPCQNGGLCFDFSSADAYYCFCFPPYTGLHCHLEQWECLPPSPCGVRTPEMIPMCQSYTSDRALRSSCYCYIPNSSQMRGIALNNCHDKNQLFIPNCKKKAEIGAVPSTNKAYYICLSESSATVVPCWLNHVWNNTQKKCVPENI